MWSKQYQCVLDTYHQILELNAESAEADMLAGEALDQMQNHQGAMDEFRAAVKADPKAPNAHFGLGYLLWTQDQFEEAAKEFQAELANVPESAQALAFLADADIHLGKQDDALPLAEKAVQIDPSIAKAHVDLGILYADRGRQEDAVKEFKAAIKLSPNDQDPHWRLARLYQAMGKQEEAKAEFEKTKTLHQAATGINLQQVEGRTGPGNTGSPAKQFAHREINLLKRFFLRSTPGKIKPSALANRTHPPDSKRSNFPWQIAGYFHEAEYGQTLPMGSHKTYT